MYFLPFVVNRAKEKVQNRFETIATHVADLRILT